jgi:hypothetical protein
MATVISVLMARLERGFPIWSVLQFAGGIMMTIFLALTRCAGASQRIRLTGPLRSRS